MGSRALVAADMPLGLNVRDGRTPDGQPRWEAVANGESGAAKGRELEFAELLSHLERRHVRNVVWLTADVHYLPSDFKSSFSKRRRQVSPIYRPTADCSSSAR
jgi:alkaline phosphatase D